MRSSFTKEKCLQWSSIRLLYRNAYFIWYTFLLSSNYTLRLWTFICRRIWYCDEHCFSIIFAVSRVSGAGCRFTRVIDMPIDHRSIVKIRLFLYELHVVHCNDEPQCVDCNSTSCRHSTCEWRIRDLNDEQNGRKKKRERDCRLIYIYLRIPIRKPVPKIFY